MKRHAALVASVLAGCASSVGQILILRELLVLFHGNELSAGIVFCCWLLWTAAGTRLAATCRQPPNVPAAFLSKGLATQALLLPATLLFIRAARPLWGIPPGELIGFLPTIAVASCSTAAFCLCSGAVFAMIWTVQGTAADRGGSHPIAVYGGEAIGAAVGGLVYYFFLLSRTTVLTSALVVSSILALGALALRRPEDGTSSSRSRFVLPLIMFTLFAAAFAWSSRIDELSHRWEWGKGLSAVRDTPYHNLAILNQEEQYSLFAGGLWLFSYPDPQTAEFAVHVALLEHPAPRTVLLIGGGAAGTLPEILKHPGIETVDYVEADPEVIRMARTFLPPGATISFGDNRIRVHLVDGAAFVRCAPRRYDIVLLNVGDPITAAMNRFYTVEFFHQVKAVLNEDGIFSFSVSSSPDVVGPAQANVLRVLDTTLRNVFQSVLVIPGENARFLACSRQGVLVGSADELTTRIDLRGLDLQYVRDYYLFDYLNPLRIDYLAKMLSRKPAPPLNRDFEPLCSYHNLIVGGMQVHPLIGTLLQHMGSVRLTVLWGGLLGTFFVIAVAFRRLGVGGRAAVGLNVMVVGGVMMGVELVLLLAFQVLRGYLYAQLALIVALFMTGTAAGAGACPRRPAPSRPLIFLSLVQVAVSLTCLSIWRVLVFLQARPAACRGEEPAATAVFPLLALAAGFLGGLHFSVATSAIEGETQAGPDIGTALYASDLAGAAAGSLAVSLFILPVFGVETTLQILAVLCLGMLPLLIRKG